MTPTLPEALQTLQGWLPPNPVDDTPQQAAARVVVEASGLRILSEDEAAFYQLADDSPGGRPARWSAAISAIVQESGKWERWPKFTAEGGYWNAMVAQSAIQNLYHCGFAVVAVTPEAIEHTELAAPEAAG